jgi:hypothetical protein
LVLFAQRIGHLVPIWQPLIGSSFQPSTRGLGSSLLLLLVWYSTVIPSWWCSWLGHATPTSDRQTVKWGFCQGLGSITTSVSFSGAAAACPAYGPSSSSHSHSGPITECWEGRHPPCMWSSTQSATPTTPTTLPSTRCMTEMSILPLAANRVQISCCSCQMGPGMSYSFQ